MTDTAQPNQGRVLTTDALEGALDLLVEAERRGEAHTVSRLVYHLAVTLSGLVGVFGVPLGALIRPIDPRLGQPLLVAGLAAVAAFTLLNTLRRDGPVLALDALRAAVEPAADTPRSEAQSRRRRRLGWAALGVGALYFAAGLGWLLYSLLVQRQVNVLALALVAWALLCVWMLAARHGYRELVHQRLVARLRRSFAGRYVEARRNEQPQVTVPAAEAAAFERVQQRHVYHNLRRALRAFVPEAEDPYALVVTPEAREALRGLPPEAQARLYERLEQLQTEPRPKDARPGTEEGAGLQLFEAGHTLSFTIDDTARRVSVAAIAAAAESTSGG